MMVATDPLGARAELKGEAVVELREIYIALALFYSVPAFRVKFGANDLNCVDVPLNPTHSLTHHGWSVRYSV